MGESKLKYGLRVLKNASFKKFTDCVNEAHRISGKSKLACAREIVHCMRKFDAGYNGFGIGCHGRAVACDRPVWIRG